MLQLMNSLTAPFLNVLEIVSDQLPIPMTHYISKVHGDSIFAALLKAVIQETKFM